MRTLLARLATLAATVAAVVACDPSQLEAMHQGAGPRVVGTGPMKKENRKTPSFRKVRADGVFQVQVRKGHPSVVVEAQQSLLKHITTSVKDGELHIVTHASMTADKPMKVWVTTNDLTGLAVSGACTVEVDAFEANEFDLDLSGATKVKLPLKAKALNAELDGASQLKITGASPKLVLELSGASRFDGGAFKVDRAKVELSGASQADLRVDKEISGEASGASKIKFRGNPKRSVEVSGVSAVEKA